MLYIFVGRMAYKNKWNTYILVILSAFSFALFYVTATLKDAVIGEFYMLMTVYFLVALGNNLKDMKMIKPIKFLTTLTDRLYLYHMIVIVILLNVFPILSEKYHVFPYTVILGIFLVTVLSIPLSLLLEKVDKKLRIILRKSIL